MTDSTQNGTDDVNETSHGRGAAHAPDRQPEGSHGIGEAIDLTEQDEGNDEAIDVENDVA